MPAYDPLDDVTLEEWDLMGGAWSSDDAPVRVVAQSLSLPWVAVGCVVVGCVLIDVARRHRAARGFRLRQPAISLALVVPRLTLCIACLRPALFYRHRALLRSCGRTRWKAASLQHRAILKMCGWAAGGLGVTQCANESATLTAGHEFGLLGITISCVTASGVTAGPTVALLGVLGLVVYALI